jgi:MFS family permease
MSTATAAPARAGLGPWIVPLLGLMVFVNYIDRGNLATAAPLMKDELGLTSTQIGLLTSAFFWTYTPGQIVAGWLAERFNAYRTLAFGLALWSLATLLTGFAGGFVAIFALRLVLGVGESAAFPCSSKMIAQHVAPTRLGAANAMLTQGAALGPAFGIFFGGLLMAGLGWRTVFILFGAASFLWLVPWLLATRRQAVAAEAPDAGPAPSFAAILRRRELWGAALGHVAGNYGFYFVISWLPLYLVKARGFSVTQMATAGGFVYLAFGAAALVGGWLTDRWIAAGATGNRARKTVFVVGNGLAAASLLVCPFAPDALALASLGIAGAGFGLASPHLFAAAQTLAGPRGAGKWVGLQNSFGNISGIVGPIVTGAIIDRTGGYDAAFVVAAAVTLVAVFGWGVVVTKIAPIDWSRS